jgi:hypothetical protein
VLVGLPGVEPKELMSNRAGLFGYSDIAFWHAKGPVDAMNSNYHRFETANGLILTPGKGPGQSV